MKTQIEKLIDRLAYPCIRKHYGDHRRQCNGEPRLILLVDMLEAAGVNPDYMPTAEEISLWRAWGRCGWSESLQSIYNRTTWEEVPAKSECKEGETNYFVQVPKQPEIRALFEYLLTLGI